MANYQYAIHEATASGDLAEVQRLFAIGGEFQSLNNEGFSPLLIAVKLKHMELIKYLLEQGAFVNESDYLGDSPLHWAALNNDLDTIKLLIESGANIYLKNHSHRMPIHVAAESGQFEIVKYFIEIGMNVNVTSRKDMTPFFIAVVNGHIQIADYLLLLKANTHLYGFNKRYIIKKAVLSGKVEAVKYLLEKSVGINYEEMFFALHLACRAGSLETVKMLLEKGAAYNILEKSRTYSPVHMAAQNGRIEVVKYFLSIGTDVDFSNSQGCSLLHIACKGRRLHLVKYLLENGADINRKILPKGATPLYIAVTNHYPEIAEFLILNGADLTQAEYKDNSILSTALNDFSVNGTAKVIIKYSVLIFNSDDKIIPDECHLSTELTQYHNKCQEEIANMKSVLIKNSTVSLHQIICGSFKGNKFLRHLCNDNIKNELKTIEDYLKDFEIYGNIAKLIQLNITKGVQRMQLLNDADLVMKKVAPKLPSEIRCKIFDYLNMTDLTAVIQSYIFK